MDKLINENFKTLEKQLTTLSLILLDKGIVTPEEYESYINKAEELLKVKNSKEEFMSLVQSFK